MEKVNIFSAENREGGSTLPALSVRKSSRCSSMTSARASTRPTTTSTTRNGCSSSSGTVVLRTPDGEHALERGDFVRFPAGPEGTHGVINRSGTPARVLLFSAARAPAVSVYPDSDRICVWPGNDVDELVFKRDTAVPWSPDLTDGTEAEMVSGKTGARSRGP